MKNTMTTQMLNDLRRFKETEMTAEEMAYTLSLKFKYDPLYFASASNEPVQEESKPSGKKGRGRKKQAEAEQLSIQPQTSAE